MQSRRARRLTAALSTAALCTALTVLALPTAWAAGAPAQATAQAPAQAPATAKGTVARDVRLLPPDVTYPLDPQLRRAQAARSSARSSGARAASVAEQGPTPPVGTTRLWLALDDVAGRLYLKPYTLRGIGDKIEVWVADDLAFPAGDCRAAVPGTTEVTDTQVADLVREFDTNIYPKESAVFSTPPSRDGSAARLAGDFSGDGDKIVTLVDNVRDENFVDFPANPTYIAGFFSAQFNTLVDRNVMTIDAFDWLHRTGAAPADEPTGDLCTSRPARPQLYEGVFAHEYQHLLQRYQDPAEVNFIDEGLSDFASALTGYANTLATVSERGQDSHLTCFQGFGNVRTAANSNPRECGGPQNSLTLWGDEGSGSEILADYGIAFSFQLFLFDRYGQEFISALHRDGQHQGLDGVQAQLDRFAAGTDVYDVLHDFQAMNLLDRYLGEHRNSLAGARRAADVTTPSLRATVNLANPAAYAKPGAAPNGADYVALRGADGPLTGRALRSLSFDGARTLTPQPLLWTSVTDAPGRAGDPTLWSGNSPDRDATAIASVTVPTSDPTLTFTERHLAEEGYDYAYTVVSTDGGRTWTALRNANTVEGPLGPALNGEAADFSEQSFDLSAYAGRTVLLGFRYVSDGGVDAGGWYVDDVRVGGTLISDGSSLSPFRSATQVRPVAVANWHLQLVGFDRTSGRARIEEFDRAQVRLDRRQLARFASYPQVVAIVAHDEPTEQQTAYAPYRLVVNGVTQPGGS